MQPLPFLEQWPQAAQAKQLENVRVVGIDHEIDHNAAVAAPVQNPAEIGERRGKPSVGGTNLLRLGEIDERVLEVPLMADRMVSFEPYETSLFTEGAQPEARHAAGERVVPGEIGTATGWDRVCQYGLILVVSVSLK